MKPIKEKAADVKAIAKENGWKVKNKKVDDGISLEFRRGGELVTAVWRDGRMRGRESLYVAGSRRFILRNAAAIKRQLATSEKEAAKANAAVREYRTTHRRPQPLTVTEDAAHELSDQERRAMLPFNPEKATAEEIVEAVRGKMLVWRNRVSGGYQSARVLERPNQHYLRVRMTRMGDPYIEFCSVNGGFVSVSLDRLVEIR